MASGRGQTLAADNATRTADKGLTPSLPEFKGTPGWEFTDISKLDLGSFEPGEPVDAAPAIFDRPASATPLEHGHELLGSVVTKEDAFTVRNRERWTHGALVHVPAGERLDEPVVIRAGVGDALEWRTLIVLEDGAEAEVWEEWVSGNGDSGFFNGVTEIVLGEGASLHYVGAQALNDSTWVFANQRAVVARDATLDWSALAFGSMRGKVWMETKLDGQGSTARVTGAYVSDGRQHLDFDTLQEHAAPDTVSDLAFRGVLGGRSSAVWRGMIHVDPGAQKTDAFQECRNLLLSKKAHADAIPGLEIQADDVRCTHAAAIAQLDKDQVFYLRSRGLTEQTAQRLIIDGFLQELVARLAEGQIREITAGALETRLAELLA